MSDYKERATSWQLNLDKMSTEELVETCVTTMIWGSFNGFLRLFNYEELFMKDVKCEVKRTKNKNGDRIDIVTISALVDDDKVREKMKPRETIVSTETSTD